jgi:L-serine/L-threonine ammonia-lyase
MRNNNYLHINTPLIKSTALSKPNQEVWLKMESMQPSGSFKNRGVGFACQKYVADGANHLMSSSGGNAGIATAYCGSELGIPVTVIVPENAPQTAKDAIRNLGANVIVQGSTWLEAHTYAIDMCDENTRLIHPFDDPLLWPGHATLIDEVVEAGLVPDTVMISVGGGGLLCGVAAGLEKNNLQDTIIIAMETLGAASLRGAIESGQPILLDQIQTIANTLGAKQVCQRAFEITRDFDVRSHLVTDLEALEACYRFLDDHRIMVEPACGATLSAVYNSAPALEQSSKVLVVVCGGMGVSMEQLKNWKNSLT